jgi:hypothetical protein
MTEVNNSNQGNVGNTSNEIVRGRKQLTQAIIEEWVALADRTFSAKDICNDIGIETPQGKQHLKVILHRLKEKGIIQTTGREGVWRKTDQTLTPIPWQQANPNAELNLIFPFGIEAVAKLYPKSIVVVAGSKQAGKTAFLLNFLVKNMNNPMGIDFFNSETGPEQLNDRLSSFNIPNPAPFYVYERYDTFSDVINPDRISVIDYMDLDSEVYLVGKEINDIFKKLNKGVAVIGLQKPPGRDLAYGSGFTAKRSQLYVSLDTNKAKLVYVKTPRERGASPDGMAWVFKLVDGMHYTDVDRFYGFDNQEVR